MNRLFSLIFVCIVFLAACSSDKPRLNRISADGTILAFGDSLTAGVGTDKAHSYPSVLAQLSGRNVINAGISGETTAEGLERFEQTLEKTRPDLVVLLEGGNDILRNYNLSDTKTNLATMIALARSNGVDVVLIGVPAKNLFSNVAPIYKELAKEHNVVFEDSMIASLLKKPKYKSDSVHFNQAGYRIMAERIYELLKENGGL